MSDNIPRNWVPPSSEGFCSPWFPVDDAPVESSQDIRGFEDAFESYIDLQNMPATPEATYSAGSPAIADLNNGVKAPKQRRQRRARYICRKVLEKEGLVGCEKAIGSIRKLGDHALEEHDVEAFGCPHCDFRTARRDYLKTHYKVLHAGDRQTIREELLELQARVATLEGSRDSPMQGTDQ